MRSVDRSQAARGQRIDRRTFLKAVALSGAALMAGGSMGPWHRSLLAAEAPQLSPIDELALALEFDRDRIFRFVAEHIRYEPYAGILRGADGTLTARAGNSADQAVLLAALLRAAGVPFRFAQGSLDAATADALLTFAESDARTAQLQLTDVLSGSGEGGRPIQAPDPDAATRARLDDAAAQGDAVVTWARDQLTETATLIETALADAGVTLAAGGTSLPLSERDDHVWVQAASGPLWLDLDPSVPAPTSGAASADPRRVYDDPPDELRHRITIEIISEVVRSGVLAEESLLRADVFADDLGGKPIGILNIEQGGLKAIGAAIAAASGEGTTYLPCLALGDDVIVGPGALRFGGQAGAGPFDDELAASDLGTYEDEPMAEWVLITIESPGADPVVVRRPIFDRLGPALRSSGAFDPSAVVPATLVQLDPEAPLDYLPAQTTHWLTVHTGVVGGEDLGTRLRPKDDLAILPGLVHGYHVVREAAAVALAPTTGVRTFLDGPNVVSLTVEQDMANDGVLMVRPTLDIWHRSAAPLPVTDVAPPHSPAMMAGILAHVAERLLFGDPFADTVTERGPSLSVGAVFDAVRREGIPVRAVASLVDLADLPFPPDTLARLAEQVTAGFVAVVPERTVRLGEERRVGWWLVDPASGSVADQLDDGRGAAIPGYVANFWRNVRNSAIMRRLGTCTAIAALGVGLFLLGEGLFAYGINKGSTVGAVLGGLSMAGAAGAGTAFMNDPNLGPKGMCY